MSGWGRLRGRGGEDGEQRQGAHVRRTYQEASLFRELPYYGASVSVYRDGRITPQASSAACGASRPQTTGQQPLRLSATSSAAMALRRR